MCGIFGILGVERVASSAIGQMLAGLKHRGPDAQNYMEIAPNYVLGMTRLAINGIENIQNQPMINPDTGDTLIFNGEIYNFSQLRQELIDLGLTFTGTSDTEVILKAYQVWGNKCFQRLKGMFAIALWDSKSKELVLARDYFGEKPLYYKESAAGLVFCSSRELIREYFGLKNEFSDLALLEFHQYGYLSRNKNLGGITEVQPGYFYVFTNCALTQKLSLNPLTPSGDPISGNLSDKVKEFDQLLTATIREEITSSEVPVGVFMSGGMDSTIIAKKAAEFCPGIEIFTASFSEKSFDESDKARRIASSFDAKQNFFFVEYSMDLITQAIEALDTPIADTSIVPFFALSKYASQTHKVCLTGDGGDEIFGGYVTYQATILNERLKRFTKLITQLKFVSNLLGAKQGNVDFRYKLRAFLENCNIDSRIAHQSWRRIFSKIEVDALFARSLEGHKDELSPVWSDFNGSPLLEQVMGFDTRTWLQDDILIKLDRMSMANSLEIRAPFLHPDIVNFAQSLPANFKATLLKRKKVLAGVFDLNFKASNVEKGRKKGFGSPMAFWIRQNPSDFKSIILDANIYNEIEIERLFSEHSSFHRDNSYRIFVLLVWSIFLRGKETNCLL